MQNWTPAQIEYCTRLYTDLEFFASECIKIVPRDGGVSIPFSFNRAQKHLHLACTLMLQEVGMVRIKGVKGRQQGFSSYVAVRFLWHAVTRPNHRVFILSHEAVSSQVLFDKVKSYWHSIPEELRQFFPTLLTDNRHELVWSNGSGYKVATAGTKETGRGFTAQDKHESERAFFDNPDNVDAGAGQIVAAMLRTEEIDESTGNGQNHYYQEYLQAIAGIGVYRFVFVPWFWTEEYKTPVPVGFFRTEEENELVSLFGLDDEQLQWRRDKIIKLKTVRKFKQEYPCTPDEAFQASGENFFDAEMVERAMQTTVNVNYGPVVIGVDCKGTGNDMWAMTPRRGRQIFPTRTWFDITPMEMVSIIAKEVDQWYRVTQKVVVFVDMAYGYAIVDRLHELGYLKEVIGVHFGESSADPTYLNKRAEMAFNLRDWLMDTPNAIARSQQVSASIASMPDSKLNSSGRHSFPSKQEIKKQLGRSPDELDSILLTFAHPVSNTPAMQATQSRNTKRGSGLTTLARIRENKADSQREPYGEPGERLQDLRGKERLWAHRE